MHSQVKITYVDDSQQHTLEFVQKLVDGVDDSISSTPSTNF